MLIGSFFFAAMSILTESLSRDFSFLWIACIRSLIATLVALTMVKMSGIRLVYFSPSTLWLRSLAGCTSMLFLFFAMTHYDVAVILSLSSTYPLWVAILGWPMLGHLPSRDTWLALIVSTLGMWLVYSSAANPTPQHSTPLYLSMPEWAIPSGILAGLLSAVALIGLHKVKDVDARAVVTHFSAVSTVISGLIWFSVPSSSETISNNPNAWFRLVAVGITAVLGQLFLTKAFATGIPARVSVVGLSQVAFAAVYQWTAKGNLPTAQSFLGMMLVVGATLWVMLRNQVSE
jgi:drug/metabolite transporter (DMT)-like permease